MLENTLVRLGKFTGAKEDDEEEEEKDEDGDLEKDEEGAEDPSRNEDD